MVRGTCQKTDCTVAVTGKCLEAHPDPESCPHFVRREAAETADRGVQKAAPPAAAARAARKLHVGLELGLQDALAVSRARYAHLIGVLGASDAGKTCFLSSLYLLACHRKLEPHYRFAGSLTLPGFELRARHLRTWGSGALPDQLVDHTTLSDPRSPAFMHLSLARGGTAERLDLLISDLPGEWTTDLVNRTTAAERFDFLRRADAVVIMAEASRLAKPASAHAEVMNLKILLERLAGVVGLDRDTPLILAATKADEVRLEMPARMRDVEEHARNQGFNPTAITLASFSRKPQEVPSGSGVLEVIRCAVEGAAPPRPATATGERPGRSFWHRRAM